MMRTWKPWAAPLALLIMLALAIAGCGGGGSTTSTSGGGGGGGSTAPASSGGKVTLNVGVIPIVDVAPLYLGKEKGFFDEQNLNVVPHLAQGGAAIVPAVQSGDFQIGFSNVVSLVIARSKGLPLKAISQGVQAPLHATEDYSAVLVKADSPIKSPKDLEGKTIAVNTLQNIGDVTIKSALEKQGVDVSKLKFVELGFPDMQAALESGRIDAMWGIEPFLTAARSAGARPVIANYAQLFKNLTVAMYFTTESYANDNPDVIKRFQAAMSKSLNYAQSHPEEVRKTILTYTKVPKAIAQKMKLPYWSDDPNKPSIQFLINQSAKYGLIQQKPSVSDLLYEGQ